MDRFSLGLYLAVMCIFIAFSCALPFEEYDPIVGGGGGAVGGDGGAPVGGAGGAGGMGAGGTGGVPEVICGAANCDVSGGQVCCSPNDAGDATCTDPPCGATFFPISCDGPEDCAVGEVCCGDYLGDSNWAQIKCATNCADASQYVICNPQEDTCPVGTTCQESLSLPTGYHTCR